MTDIVQVEERKTPRKRATDAKVYARSKIKNGGEVLPQVDGRTLIAKRYREIADALLADQDGESQNQLIRRFAAAACIAEQMEAALANGEDVNAETHALLCSTLIRLANKFGIKGGRSPAAPTPPAKNTLGAVWHADQRKGQEK